jgi:ribonuclease HI
MIYRLYTDGASRGNPGKGGAGAILYDEAGEAVSRRKHYLGVCTNNTAEYKGLILGLEAALRHGCRRLHIFMDSELLVRQINGSYRVKNENLKPLMAEVKRLLSFFDGYVVEHIERSKNKAADQLANEAIDEAEMQGLI